MPGLGWLTARPIAHRGLHGAGVVENTASAVTAAIAGGYGIEVDVQISADGEAMVHHDDALGRLTDGAGALRDLSVAELKRVPFKNSADRMLTLGELCDLVAVRATLVVELKSRFDGDRRIAERVATVLESSAGPVAAMSFDPELVGVLRRRAPKLVRGIVAERHFAPAEWRGLTVAQRTSLAFLLHAPRTCPHFVAYRVQDLPALAPLAARHMFCLPLLTWTVRSAEDRLRAKKYADQMIFEGFRP
jgi:glycerophosphoryl diester phosphodiesterase